MKPAWLRVTLIRPVVWSVGLAVALFYAASSAFSQTGDPIDRFTVAAQEVDDLKAVYATVQSRDLTLARVRTGGTVMSLSMDEGALVKAGQVLAIVADPKFAYRIAALDAKIVGLKSRIATARSDYERASQLRQRNVTPQARVDQLKTALDVANNELKSARSERGVLDQQVAEGRVLAPADGRVLSVSVTTGSVVMAGESIATIAANEFLLRLALPERHARFIKRGDSVKVGARGLSLERGVQSEGRIVQVYPKLQSGRVIADAEVSNLGDYFVGERALVWISAGRRQTIVVPEELIFRRFGQDFVRLVQSDGSAIDVVVQPGHARRLVGDVKGREVLAGLKPGDVITKASATP